MSTFRKFCTVGFLFSSLLLNLPAQAAEQTLDRIVAIVNQHVITEQQLQEELEIARQTLQAQNKPLPLETQLKKEVLDQLIDVELQRQLVKKVKVQIDDATVDKTIHNIATQNHWSLDELRQRLEQDHLPYAKYRHKIREQLAITRLQQMEIGAKITITPQEITDKLAHKAQWLPPDKTRYHIEDVLIALPDYPSADTQQAGKKIALQLKQQLESGQSALKAIEQSQSRAFPLSLNDLGWRTLAELPDLFQPTIKSLKPGNLSTPLQAANGFHLLRLIDRQNTTDDQPLHAINIVHLRHILIKVSPLLSDVQAEKRLKELRAEILRGTPFAEVARKYSQDPGSAAQGGDLGWRYPNSFVPAFEAQVKKLELNQISLPFKTDFGWHIVEVLARQQKIEKPEDRLREQATQLIYRQKFEQGLKSWLQTLRQQSYIKIDL